MEGDPLGRLQLSPFAIIERDELVFRLAYETYKVPIVMLLSGGYQQTNAPTIALSILNLVRKFDLKMDREEGRLGRREEERSRSE